MTPIRAVVFDLGGVLITDPDNDDRLDDESVFGPADADTDHPWHRLERGEHDLATTIDLLRTGDGSPNLLTARPSPPSFRLVQPMVALAEQLHESGCRTALLTNNVRELRAFWWGLFPWSDIFDALVESHEVGVRKPDPRAFELAFTRLGTAAEATLVVDDRPANLAVATELGASTELMAGDPDATAARIGRRLGVERLRDKPRRSTPELRRRGANRSEADHLLEQVLFDPKARDDPYPLLHRLRESAPAFRFRDSRVWYLSRYRDCQMILRDKRFGKVGDSPNLDFVTGEPIPPPPPEATLPLPFIDPPEHGRVRALFSRVFQPSDLLALRPSIARALDEFFESVQTDQPFDLVSGFSFPMAIRIICDVVGVPSADRLDFTELITTAATSFEPGLAPDQMTTAFDAIKAMTDYFEELTASRVARPGDDLVSQLLAARTEAAHTDDPRWAPAAEVGDDEIVASVVFLFAAGYETVAHLLTTAVYLLWSHPEQLAAVVEDREKLNPAIDEVLRYEAPVQLNSRLVLDDVEIAGGQLRRGDVAVTLIGAANRDPAEFDDPDEFRIDRTSTRSVSFGSGIHHCLGHNLARMEASMAVEKFLDSGLDLELPTAPPTWRPAIVLRGLDRLDVSLVKP